MNLLWPAAGTLIGAVGLVGVATLFMNVERTASASAAQTHTPKILPTVGAQRASGGSRSPGGGSDKPNVVFIMRDDIGWMQPSIYQ
jgi:hypothetical protein